MSAQRSTEGTCTEAWPVPRNCCCDEEMHGPQLEIMSGTSVLITPCGGTGTVLTFLQPGATAIIMNYWQSVRKTRVQMEAIYYWNLEYLDLQVGSSGWRARLLPRLHVGARMCECVPACVLCGQPTRLHDCRHELYRQECTIRVIPGVHLLR